MCPQSIVLKVMSKVSSFDNPFTFYNMHLMVRNHTQIKRKRNED